MIQSIMNTGRASPPFGSTPFSLEAMSQGSVDGLSPEEVVGRKRYMDAKILEAETSAPAAQASKLAAMMNDPQFELFEK